MCDVPASTSASDGCKGLVFVPSPVASAASCSCKALAAALAARVCAICETDNNAAGDEAVSLPWHTPALARLAGDLLLWLWHDGADMVASACGELAFAFSLDLLAGDMGGNPVGDEVGD